MFYSLNFENLCQPTSSLLLSNKKVYLTHENMRIALLGITAVRVELLGDVLGGFQKPVKLFNSAF